MLKELGYVTTAEVPEAEAQSEESMPSGESREGEPQDEEARRGDEET